MDLDRIRLLVQETLDKLQAGLEVQEPNRKVGEIIFPVRSYDGDFKCALLKYKVERYLGALDQGDKRAISDVRNDLEINIGESYLGWLAGKASQSL